MFEHSMQTNHSPNTYRICLYIVCLLLIGFVAGMEYQGYQDRPKVRMIMTIEAEPTFPMVDTL